MQRSVAVRRTVAAGIDSCGPDAPVVLLVTADRDLREVAARVLGREGYQVLTAAHAGHAALACMQAPRVDIALIELSMADMSGPALVDRLRRHVPGLRALYLGQTGTQECDGVLVRPFTRDDLLAELAVTLAQPT